MSEVFIEIRTEELPPSMVRPALDGLQKGLVGLLAGIDHGEVKTWATPRRLAVAIGGVAAEVPTVEKIVTGPPADRAFDADGKPTQAAIGFAKGKGKDPSEIRVVDGPKGKVIALSVAEGGERTMDRLRNGLEGVIRGIPFHKTMVWANGGLRFGRPIGSIAALFGGEVIPGAINGIPYGNSTVAHRLADDKEFTFASSAEWLSGLRSRYVEPDLDARKAAIRDILDSVSASERADHIDDPDLVEQVTHLVEWPTRMVCEFEAELLHLPPRLLVESMRVHQRNFPIHQNGKLTNRFVVISNSPEGDVALVSAGNARVLRARFYDAKFFFAEDKKKRLEAHGAGLQRMRWIKGLGMMSQKQLRVSGLAARLCTLIGADAPSVLRAGELLKADLLTAMVNEFPELQGHMGRLYATAQGESDKVAWAIEEHWQPRFAGDVLPNSREGLVLALADRLDTLVGCFGVGLVPKGGGDPQGLRRAAVGIVAMILGQELDLDVAAVFRMAIENFHAAVLADPAEYQAWIKERGSNAAAHNADPLVAELVAFVLARYKAGAVDEGANADVVDAVIGNNPVAAHNLRVVGRKVAALVALQATPEFVPMMQMFKRVMNISKPHADSKAAASGAADPAEVALLAAVNEVTGRVEQPLVDRDYSAVIRELLVLREPIARFFDDVLVDDPDPAVRARRIGLLQRVAGLLGEVADFARITTR